MIGILVSIKIRASVHVTISRLNLNGRVPVAGAVLFYENIPCVNIHKVEVIYPDSVVSILIVFSIVLVLVKFKTINYKSKSSLFCKGSG